MRGDDDGDVTRGQTTVDIRDLSSAAEQFNWLLNRFASEVAGVEAAIAVSSDGLLVAMSQDLNRERADRLAAITSALTSLAAGASRVYDLGNANKVIIDLDRGFVVVSAISAGAALAVLARRDANLGDLAYEMALFAGRAGDVLSPRLIEELKNSVGAGLR
jgi:hypothetical protein